MNYVSYIRFECHCGASVEPDNLGISIRNPELDGTNLQEALRLGFVRPETVAISG
jgi:hypothetical protein